jgi:hypothetical protein
MRQGRIDFVELRSQTGAELRMKNPWGEARLSLFRNGQPAGAVSGADIKLSTARGETLVLAPASAKLDTLRRTLDA